MTTTKDPADAWGLDPSVVFLNHGSFGACPVEVLAAQSDFRAQLERNPMDFLLRAYEPLLDTARERLAEFVGADSESIAFVSNPTTGVNTLLRSMTFKPGDEILITDHGYNACSNAARSVASDTGAVVTVAHLPWPIASSDEVVESVLEAVTPRTKLVLLDHVTSPTALVLPVERLAREIESRGIDLLVDGAHAPGMLPLDLRALDVPYYVGHCHKWMSAPKGAAFLSVRQDRRSQVRPLVVSHGANSPRTDRTLYQLEFDWTGTADPTAWLSVPASIDVMGGLIEGGWPALMASNRSKALAARSTLCAALQCEESAPEEMIGSMASVVLPAEPGSGEVAPLEISALQEGLWSEHRIEVPVHSFPESPQRLIRVSAQLYNRSEQYEQLASAVTDALKRESARSTERL
ncbi:MAG: aminotransferase class V-fold PLP-dependent enzyme [Planctomycetota bacterium]|jgi:isopenicillin-N epimerase|nr:aminotransferase class V-fold PLP-dependent enzyme [Planctomycetota bacterium]